MAQDTQISPCLPQNHKHGIILTEKVANGQNQQTKRFRMDLIGLENNWMNETELQKNHSLFIFGSMLATIARVIVIDTRLALDCFFS